MSLTLASVFVGCYSALAAPPPPVVVVLNTSSPLSVQIATYYARVRQVPEAQMCRITTPAIESVTRAVYDQDIAKPIANCLSSRHLTESTLYLVTTQGVPLRVLEVKPGEQDGAAVDSELALLYATMHGQTYPIKGRLPNPFYSQRTVPFTHPRFPMYLVTRLAGYDWHDIQGIIDRCGRARNVGKFVFDLRNSSDEQGNDWLRTAALSLPRERVILEDSDAVLKDQRNVIGYASWGSNDSHRKDRFLNFQWLPGAIVSEYVSTSGRTFVRPPDTWKLGVWGDKSTWFDGSPQSMTADVLHEGASGASGHVDEPYLIFTPHPDLLFPAYWSGRTLAESYYLAIPSLSWQNIVVGDPLCSIGPPP